jgi:hypothetical protein
MDVRKYEYWSQMIDLPVAGLFEAGVGLASVPTTIITVPI